MTIFRDYDQAGLDAQYNNRAAVPDHPAYFERWARDSAQARETLPCRLDLAYGPGERERLDIFPAGGGASAPALVFIHGGYWKGLDKSDFSYPATALVDAGIAYVAIRYPLAPAAGMDEIVASVRRALAWLWREGRGHGVDPARLVVSGHSAGGHLTAMLLATDWPAVADDLPADLVKGGLSISGLYDLEPVRLSYHNAELRLDAAAARRNSPLHHLPATAPPLALVVGAEETDEFRRQQQEFLAAWRARGLEGSGAEFAGLNHFSIVDGFYDPASPLQRTARALLAGRLETA